MRIIGWMLLTGLLVVPGLSGCGGGSGDGGGSKSLIESVLAGVRTPRDDQFPDPESAVRFLFEQVKRRDLTEATRVFPIRERYRLEKLETHAEYLRMFSYPTTPVPGAKFHNLSLALQDLEVYEQLSMICLGFDPAQRRILEDDPGPDVEELKRRLDFSRLTALEIHSLEANEPLEISADHLIDNAIGATHEARVEVHVLCDGTDVSCVLSCFKIGSNWRVKSLIAVNGLDADTWRTKGE